MGKKIKLELNYDGDANKKPEAAKAGEEMAAEADQCEGAEVSKNENLPVDQSKEQKDLAWDEQEPILLQPGEPYELDVLYMYESGNTFRFKRDEKTGKIIQEYTFETTKRFLNNIGDKLLKYTTLPTYDSEEAFKEGLMKYIITGEDPDNFLDDIYKFKVDQAFSRCQNENVKPVIWDPDIKLKDFDEDYPDGYPDFFDGIVRDPIMGQDEYYLLLVIPYDTTTFNRIDIRTYAGAMAESIYKATGIWLERANVIHLTSSLKRAKDDSIYISKPNAPTMPEELVQRLDSIATPVDFQTVVDWGFGQKK